MRSGLDPGTESHPPYKSPVVRSIPVVEWQLQYSKYCSDPLCHSLGNIYGSKPSRPVGSQGKQKETVAVRRACKWNKTWAAEQLGVAHIRPCSTKSARWDWRTEFA